MWRILVKLVITVVAMLVTFLGLRGVAMDFWPEAHAGWIEMAAYVVSAVYGPALYNWLGAVLPYDAEAS